MNGLEFIKSKQQNWAKRKGFELVGGTIPNKGEKKLPFRFSEQFVRAFNGRKCKKF